ncbi:MAG TPA: hypothetical protein VGR16_15450 [Thermomicrobiales bacterium]|nr:hypothetical protein [Thermomicrobiales bacterium]
MGQGGSRCQLARSSAGPRAIHVAVPVPLIDRGEFRQRGLSGTKHVSRLERALLAIVSSAQAEAFGAAGVEVDRV